MNVNYVNSVMDELNEYNAELYEALMDGSQEDVTIAIRKINKVLTDIRKSMSDDSINLK
jgi:hypothetical protein